MNRTAARIVIAVAVVGAVAIVIDAGLRDDPAPTLDTAPKAAEPSKSPPRIERAERVRAVEAPSEAAPAEPEMGRRGELTVPPPRSTDPDTGEVVTEWKEPEKPSRNDHVVWGLRWLKDHQAEDGSWHDPATTGIALLAFLGAGETHQSGTSRDNVRNGLKYLRGVQDADGCLVPRDAPRMLRDHAVAALALVEAYGMTGSRVFKESAQRAVAFALKVRTPSSGWGANGVLDVETTGWMSMLLKSAKLCEFDVDVAVLTDAVRAIDQVTDHQTGRVTATGGVLPDETATAIGIFVRAFAGHDAKDDEVMRKGAEMLASKMPTWADGATPDHVYQYLGTIGMSKTRSDRLRAWRDALQATVDAGQVTDEGSADFGSWGPAGEAASAKDRVWSTAFNLLCAEWYGFGGYRHAQMRR